MRPSECGRQSHDHSDTDVVHCTGKGLIGGGIVHFASAGECTLLNVVCERDRVWWLKCYGKVEEEEAEGIASQTGLAIAELALQVASSLHRAICLQICRGRGMTYRIPPLFSPPTQKGKQNSFLPAG